MTAARHLEPVEERDYRADMRDVIDAETAAGNYVSAIVAEHIVRKLAVTDPDLLNGWLYANAAFFIRHFINLRDSASRTSARTQARRLEFATAAGKFEKGDAAPLTSFLGVVHVVEDGSRKKLADLTAADLNHVANDYEARAQENALHAMFLRKLAAKIGKRTVGQVFDEKKLAEMWLSLSGS
jgi:hypothetical protein